MQVVLQRYDFCGWRLEKLHTQLSQALEQAVREQIIGIMRTSNLDDKMYTLRSWKNSSETEALSQMAGMDAIAGLPLSLSPRSLPLTLHPFFHPFLPPSLPLTPFLPPSIPFILHPSLSLSLSLSPSLPPFLYLSLSHTHTYTHTHH